MSAPSEQPGQSTSDASEPPQSSDELAQQVLQEIQPFWLRLGRQHETERLAQFLLDSGQGSVWVHGDQGCGLNEFLKIAVALLKAQGFETLIFDGQDTDYGIAVGRRYFLYKLERWAGIDSAAKASPADDNIDQRFTDDDGRYIFHSVPAALYKLVEVCPWGHEPTTPSEVLARCESGVLRVDFRLRAPIPNLVVFVPMVWK